MRIIAGTIKGKKIVSKPVKGIRSTSAKVREALFNILKDKIMDSFFLELYAGTGAVGLEALSRGAEKVVFVDMSATSIRSISEFTKERFNSRVAAIKGKADLILKKLGRSGERFDIVFADPPYNSPEAELIMPILGEMKIIKNSTAVVVEHSDKKRLSNHFGDLNLKKKYHYGDTVLSLYEAV